MLLRYIAEKKVVVQLPKCINEKGSCYTALSARVNLKDEIKNT
jgi:hypothetical protein